MPEDSLALRTDARVPRAARRTNCRSSAFRCISNATDFSLLTWAEWITAPSTRAYDFIILPGQQEHHRRSCVASRDRPRRLDRRAAIARGATVIGVCGGYQMLGRTIADPGGVESSAGRADGLGLIPADHGARWRENDTRGPRDDDRGRCVRGLRDSSRCHHGRSGCWSRAVRAAAGRYAGRHPRRTSVRHLSARCARRRERLRRGVRRRDTLRRLEGEPVSTDGGLVRASCQTCGGSRGGGLRRVGRISCVVCFLRARFLFRCSVRLQADHQKSG